MPTISVWELAIEHGEGWFQNGNFSITQFKQHFNLEPSRGGPVGIIMYQSVSGLLHLGKPTSVGTLNVKHFEPSLDISSDLFPAPTSIPHVLSIFQVDPVKGHFRLLILVEPCWEAYLSSHSCQYVGKHFSSVSYNEKSHQGCFGRLGYQRCPITTFNPLAVQRSVMQTRNLFLSMSGSDWGSLNIQIEG